MLHYADYDANGSVDPLMSYYIKDKAYPLPTRDELTDQVPSFKKKFTNYNDYTQATIENIINEEQQKKSTVLKAFRFETTYFRNDGKSFEMIALPKQIQFAPVCALSSFDVNGDGALDLITGGNISAGRSRFGRASANFGTVLMNDGKGTFKYISPEVTGISVSGDVRGIVVDQSRIIFGVNNSKPVVYERKKAPDRKK
jgi:hypothetical protein